MKKKQILYLLFLSLLVLDISYSFLQYRSTQIHGDIAGGVVPAKQVKPILKSPFGLQLVFASSTKEKYPNPNRFFSHWALYKYFRKMPIFLQKFVPPIESVYLASGLIKIITHIFLIFVLAALITHKKINSLNFLLAALLVSPLFQTNGYKKMTIVNEAITYTFFYAIPFLILVLFLAAFYKLIVFNEVQKWGLLKSISLWGLVIIIPFSGPLNTGIFLIVALLVFASYFIKMNIRSLTSLRKLRHTTQQIPNNIKLYFIPLFFLSLYSLYLSRLGSPFENGLNIPTILERYQRLPFGLFYTLTTKLGFPLLIIAVLLNLHLISKHYPSAKGRIIIKSAQWFFAFSLLYILALPLGGYRPYRPNIIRQDTFIPITYALIYLFGTSTYYLLFRFRKNKNIYFSWILLLLLIYKSVDLPYLNDNIKEKNALQKIAKSSEQIVPLDCNCEILSWHVIQTPEESELNSKLLQIWRITESPKLYYNSKQQAE